MTFYTNKFILIITHADSTFRFILIPVLICRKKRRRPNQYEAVEISERLLTGNRAQLQFVVNDDDDDDDDNGGVKGVSYANVQTSQDDDEQRYTASRPRESTPF